MRGIQLNGKKEEIGDSAVTIAAITSCQHFQSIRAHGRGACSRAPRNQSQVEALGEDQPFPVLAWSLTT
jgi:hypothetical protein